MKDAGSSEFEGIVYTQCSIAMDADLFHRNLNADFLEDLDPCACCLPGGSKRRQGAFIRSKRQQQMGGGAGGWRAEGIWETQPAFHLWPRSEAGFGLDKAGHSDTSAGQGESTKDILSPQRSQREPPPGLPLIGQMVTWTKSDADVPVGAVGQVTQRVAGQVCVYAYVCVCVCVCMCVYVCVYSCIIYYHVVIFSLSDAIYVLSGGGGNGLSVVRMARVFRVVRIFHKLEDMKRILNANVAALGPVLNAFLLFLVIISMYASHLLGLNPQPSNHMS